MNKVSEVKHDELERIKQIIRTLQPAAEIIECDYADVDLNKIIYTEVFDFERTATSAGWIRGIESALTEEQKKEAEEHEHHHHHDGECGCGHDHEHHHHHDGEACSCGHDHDHHHADEVFTSWGLENVAAMKREDLDRILDELAYGDQYGEVLRAKGMVPGEKEGSWLYFDLVPEQYEIRDGSPEYTGKVCVIGAKLKEDELKKAFGR